MLRFVAIVDGRNQPVFFQSAPETPPNVAMNQQFIAEMSLDFVEQQLPQLQSQLHRPHLIVIHDGIVVYALLTNTRTKYILGFGSTVEPDRVDASLRAVADAYTGYQCSPFGKKDGPIQSSKFENKIEEIITG